MTNIRRRKAATIQSTMDALASAASEQRVRRYIAQTEAPDSRAQ